MINSRIPASSWRKSTYSGSNGGECIEVDDANPGTVRDSKDPHGPTLAFPADAFAAFLAGVKNGEFGTA